MDRFLLRAIEHSPSRRQEVWHRNFVSQADPDALPAARLRLARMLGARDTRVPDGDFEYVATTRRGPKVGAGDGFTVFEVRWPAFGEAHGEGLWLVPHANTADASTAGSDAQDGSSGAKPKLDVIAIPDADQTPEQIAGLVDGVTRESQFARRLAESGCRVLIPVLVSREREARRGRANLTHREFIHRPAYEMGRTLIGYEVEKVLAAVDIIHSWRAGQPSQNLPRDGLKTAGIRVIGWGEGGRIALYAGAMDTRIDAVCVSGYFDDRRSIWKEPLDRNVFGLLEEFGDAELAALIAPRNLIIEAAAGPELFLSGEGGAPGRLTTPSLEAVRREVERARQLTRHLGVDVQPELIVSGDGQGPYGSLAALQSFLTGFSEADGLARDARTHTPWTAAGFDAKARQQRQWEELDRHTQRLLLESPDVRREFMSKLDFKSQDSYLQSVEPYRRYFEDEVIGSFDQALLPPNPRVRKSYAGDGWTGYEVVLDVFEDVFAYGILLVPEGASEDEQRPVVVCQHGLEGRPQDVIAGDHPAYHDFASRLAERGFFVFAPQNPYIFGDRFRTLQRKANPLKKTLFSIIVPQHRQIVNWLSSLPQVDPERIGFYGLSYGGKTAMRVPPLVPGYCLSICSADFNDWIWKNVSTRSPYSYVWTGEYEIFEFDLGRTFNYSEMAALIAPRPFMVERGHFDGVAPDERVAYEFAKVRFLYQARLGIPERCEIEWFVGPHTIHGKGTFDFLHRHLKWPLR